MIRFRFTADPAESIAFSYSPLLEAVLSLHVVTEPKHLPLQHRWVRKARTLPAALRRELAAFSFAYSSFVPEFLMPSPAAGYHTFEDELQALEHLDEETLALGFLRPLYDHRGERTRGCSRTSGCVSTSPVESRASEAMSSSRP
jgi:hypothetical protein